MPSKNAVKKYVPGGYYHLYNRGVNKQPIFNDSVDYGTLLTYLASYLTPKDTDSLLKKINDSETSVNEKQSALLNLRLNNFHGKIAMLAYCLMPNHYHFLIRQHEDRAIESMMKSLMTRYTMYFNRRHNRVGSLFQGVYKGTIIETDTQKLFLSRYIHRNPLELLKPGDNRNWGDVVRSQPSSYKTYLGESESSWVQPKEILNIFSKEGYSSYLEFIEWGNPDLDFKTTHLLENLTLELS